MQKEIISIVNEVLDKHLKGDLEAAVDLNKVSEEYRDVCKKLNSLLNSERENTKVAFEKESNFRRIFLQIGNLCNQVLKGNLSQRMNTLALAFEMRPMGTVLNRVFDSLQENIEELKDKESNLKTAISSFGSVLSSASEGDLTRKVDLSEISEEYRPIGRNINGMISATQQNIEELRSRTEVIKKSQEYTRSLFYSIPNPTSILDLEGRRIDTAKSTEDLFRIPRDEILGSKVEDLYAKEDLKKIRETMERGKEGYSSCETTCIRGDGTEFPAVLSFAPVRDNDGNLINIVYSATDITELRSREEEVEERRAYFQNFFNSSPVPLTLIGLDGKRVDCNPAMERLTGRSKKELVYVPVEATYVKEEQELVRKKLVDETIENGYMHGFETYFRKPDRTKLPMVANTALIRDTKGKPLSIVYSAVDITELKKREEELEQAKAYTEAIINNQPIGLVIYRADDPERKWRVVNSALEKITGYDAEEIVGKSGKELPFNTGEAREIVEEVNKKFEREDYRDVAVYELLWIHRSGKLIIVRVRTARIGNDYVDTIEDVTEVRERELALKNAILTFGSVLSSAASGDLKAKVDLSKIAEEYKPIGEDINSMISARKHETDRLKQREGEMDEALTLYGYTLEKIVGEGDLSVRVNIDRLSGKHKLIGTYVNLLIGSLQTKIEESKKT
jgi:PAS domain S-box-containing protein